MCLTTSDPEAQEAAREALAPWLVEKAPASWQPSEWKLQRSGSGWRLIDPEGNSCWRRSLPRALAWMEHAAAARWFQSSSLCVVHAALLQRCGQRLLLVGPRRAGKTTLGLALSRAGWFLLADEAVIVEGSDAFPVPRRVSLRPGSQRQLGDSVWSELQAGSGSLASPRRLWVRPPLPPRPWSGPVGDVLLLQAAGDRREPHRAEPLTALRQLLVQSSCGRQGLRSGMAALAPLVNQARCWHLPRAPLRQWVSWVNGQDLVTPNEEGGSHKQGDNPHG